MQFVSMYCEISPLVKGLNQNLGFGSSASTDVLIIVITFYCLIL